MKNKNPQISIIIPVLDEEEYIKKVVVAIQTNATSRNIKELLIIDGGSTDNTIHEAKALGAKVISSEPGGRGKCGLAVVVVVVVVVVVCTVGELFEKVGDLAEIAGPTGFVAMVCLKRLCLRQRQSPAFGLPTIR